MAQPKNTTTAPAGKGSAAFDAAAQAARGPAQDVQNDEPEPDPDAQALVKSVKGGEIAVANGVWTSAPKYIQLAKLGDQITGRLQRFRGAIQMKPEIVVDSRTGEVTTVVKDPVATWVVRVATGVLVEFMGAYHLDRGLAIPHAMVLQGMDVDVICTREGDRKIGIRNITDYDVKFSLVAPVVDGGA